ncbi:DUF4280 domain-containing protein [Aquimarina longa]|uniref:DUF4280 domain-containing protein n=1 Tax=Aquimarina longa TaxID=1080221 RepID=UPI0009E6FBD1|nr:DUF4280 domain-containing protein [Aquimarina longa]
MSTGHIVVDGAMCKCKFGNTPDTLVVQSQQKAYINDDAASKKLVANTMDLGMPLQAKTFGQCKLQPSSSGFLPCVPAITIWQDAYDKVELSNSGQVLTENSKATCAIAGAPCVEFTWHGQTAAPDSSNVAQANEQEQVHLNPLVNIKALEEVVEEFSVQNYTEGQQEQDLRFKAYFTRLPDYKGEFGFDWMRYDYIPTGDRDKDICDDYDKLKKEYTPFKIEGEEYFVPWISMFPKQEGVQLNLSVCTYTEHTPITDQDIIKLPVQNGIRFEPDEIKVSEANMDNILVTIYCDTPLTKDTTIELKDKDNITVGKINFLKNSNHKDLHFEITPVRILRSIAKEEDKKTIENRIDQGFGDPNKNLSGDLQNLQDYLNTQSLNQALLQCTIGKVYDIIIDEKEWIKHQLIVEEGCLFKGVLLDEFNKEFEKQHPKVYRNRGITVYISPLNHSKYGGEEGAGGYGNLKELGAKGLVVFQSNLNDKTSFTHEIAHVAGLDHSFKEKDNLTKKKVINYNEYITQVDARINYLFKIKASKEQIKEEWQEYKSDYKFARSRLNIYYRNLYKFKQGKTDNFMDYYNIRKTFWKFQWKALQDDIIKFYKK